MPLSSDGIRLSTVFFHLNNQFGPRIYSPIGDIGRKDSHNGRPGDDGASLAECVNREKPRNDRSDTPDHVERQVGEETWHL